MKSFQSLQIELDERVVRAGAVAAFGARSRKEGKDSVRAFKQGQQALRKGGPDVDVEHRIKRIELALNNLFYGLIAQRQQIGAGVAVDVVGHALKARSAKRR